MAATFFSRSKFAGICENARAIGRVSKAASSSRRHASMSKKGATASAVLTFSIEPAANPTMIKRPFQAIHLSEGTIMPTGSYTTSAP